MNNSELRALVYIGIGLSFFAVIVSFISMIIAVRG